MTFGYVKGIIDSLDPILAKVMGVNTKTNAIASHMAVICGYMKVTIEALNMQQYYYKIIDSNYNGVLLALTTSTDTNFAYSHGDYTYNTWERYFY